jgi:para-nitrobenzyl esterase
MTTVVETSTGKLRGAVEEGLHVFRGIPFAKPPTGDLRFRGPQAVEPWDGVRDATCFGGRAMQVPNEALEAFLGRPKDRPPIDEDCLYLNVWTPGIDGRRRPAMVWIHGGGFTIGAGSEPLYDGSALASRDIVVVTINYRLGPFGFLYLPGFASAPGEPCTNFGMLDQVAALQWVRDNIEAFGGDPKNVTIFGESAGGMSVGALMASPLAAGLFHKAILQSGAAHNALTVGDARENAAAFAEALGVNEIHASLLRSLPAEKILGGQTVMQAEDAKRAGRMVALRFQPVIDGHFLPQAPIEAIRGGLSRDVPVLLGTTLEEWKLFTAMNPALREISEDRAARQIGRLVSEDGDAERGRAILRAYRDARAARGEPDDAYEVYCAAMTDWMFRVRADRLAEAQVGHQPKVFAYRFDRRSPAGNGILGACHALDIAFVFGTQRIARAFVGGGADADALAKTMGDAWVAFARKGDPSTDSLPWPPFDAVRRRTMILDRECRAEELPQEAERDCWDGIIA